MDNALIPLTDQWLERLESDPPAAYSPEVIKILAGEIRRLRQRNRVQKDTILQMQFHHEG
ncbi:MAG: hypothetical protein ACLQBD_01130 [Syntrophobacteraceae bacterium]